MLSRIFYITLLLLPSYASWYPKGRVSFASAHEKENKPLVPTKKFEVQGYHNIILLTFFGVTVLISLIYYFAIRHPKFPLTLLYGLESRFSRVMSKLGKEWPEDDPTKAHESEKCTGDEFTPASPPEPVPPPNPQPCTDPSTQQDDLPDEVSLSYNDKKECVDKKASGPIHRMQSKKSLQNEDNLKNSEKKELKLRKDDSSCSSKETEKKQPLLETTKQIKRAGSVELRKQSFTKVVSKSKSPEIKPSPTKSIGTKLPQKVSISQQTEKTAGKAAETTPSLPKVKKQSTESIPKKQGKKETTSPLKKEASATQIPCKCASLPSVEKLVKEIETLKRRIASAEKAKREAIRDSDIHQKSMASLKVAMKMATEENAKLKRQLEVAKRDKTETVKRMTAKWREKLSQLEEKMRVEVEETSNKRDSVRGNVISNNSKIKPDVEEVPVKVTPNDSPRLYRGKNDLLIKIQDRVRDELREKERKYKEVGSPRDGINEIKCEGVRKGETVRKYWVIDTACEDRESSVSNQVAGEEVVDDSVVLAGEVTTDAAVTDANPKEDVWKENDDGYSPKNADNDAALRAINSEVAARLDLLRARELLDDRGTGREIPSCAAEDLVKKRLEEIIKQTLGSETQLVDAEGEINVESATASEDLTNPPSNRDSESAAPSSAPIFTSTEESPATCEENETDTALSENGHRRGRLARRARRKENNTSVDIAIVGKKSHPEESLQSKTENMLPASKSKVNVAKAGLTPKPSEKKILAAKPPVPKPNGHRTTSKNEVDLHSIVVNKENGLSNKMTRTITGSPLAQRMNADQIQSPSKFLKGASYTKLAAASDPTDLDNRDTGSSGPVVERVNEMKDREVETVDDGDMEKLEVGLSDENPVREIFHSGTNQWAALEEETNCHVIDETNHNNEITTKEKDKDAEESRLEENSTAYVTESGEKATEETAEHEMTEEEIAAEVAKIYQEECRNEAEYLKLNAAGANQIEGDMELEARNYIEDLLDLSSSLSAEEKKEVEQLLGQCFSAGSPLQNLSSVPSSGTGNPRDSGIPNKSSNDDATTSNDSEGTSVRTSSTAPAIELLSELRKEEAGGSSRTNSPSPLGRGFLTGKLNQCFVYDPEKLKDQRTDALKNFMKMVGKPDESRDIS